MSPLASNPLHSKLCSSKLNGPCSYLNSSLATPNWSPTAPISAQNLLHLPSPPALFHVPVTPLQLPLKPGLYFLRLDANFEKKLLQLRQRCDIKIAMKYEPGLTNSFPTTPNSTPNLAPTTHVHSTYTPLLGNDLKPKYPKLHSYLPKPCHPTPQTSLDMHYLRTVTFMHCTTISHLFWLQEDRQTPTETKVKSTKTQTNKPLNLTINLWSLRSTSKYPLPPSIQKLKNGMVCLCFEEIVFLYTSLNLHFDQDFAQARVLLALTLWFISTLFPCGACEEIKKMHHGMVNINFPT